MKALVLIALTGCLHWSPLHAQPPHQITIFYPAYEEFSFDPEIAQTLNPTFANIRHRASKPDQPPWYAIYPRLERPPAIGFMYTRQVDQHRAWRFSWYAYHTNRAGVGYKPGLTIRMTHHNFSVDRSQVIWRSVNEKLTLSSYLQGTFRIGQDTYWINYVGWVDIYPYRQLADIGAAMGLVGKWHMTRHIHLGLEAGYTRWLFLYSNILDRDYYHQLKPWNQLDFKLTLGYAFGKEAPRGHENALLP